MPNTILWKDGPTYQKAQATDSAFTTITPAGHTAPYSGLYRCVGCGHIVVSTAGNHMPPQNHPQHSVSQGAIRWELVVTHV
jgi:hypothetical protein